VRFEILPGEQAQVDLPQFEVIFTDEPSAVGNVRLFSLVLGYSRLIWARFVARQTGYASFVRPPYGGRTLPKSGGVSGVRSVRPASGDSR
jgi:hypothetical protein